MTKAEVYLKLKEYCKDKLKSYENALGHATDSLNYYQNESRSKYKERYIKMNENHLEFVTEQIEFWKACVELFEEESEFHIKLLSGR